MSRYASSPLTGPTKRLGYPYQGIKAWLGVGCDGKSEWAYVGFKRSPNLTDTDTKDGYNLARTRMKWDETIRHVYLSQDWGDRFLHFRHDDSVISEIAKASSGLLELSFYKAGMVYFNFSLKGSLSAIQEVRRGCAK